MSLAVSTTPPNQDHPLLVHSPLPSDQRRNSRTGRMNTLLDLLTIDKMDGSDQTTMIMRSNGASSRWRILKERLGLSAVGCCGAVPWRYTSYRDSPSGDREREVGTTSETRQTEGEGMNLAAALEAERELSRGGESNETPARVSLMRLLEETSVGCDVERERRGGSASYDIDSMCCVCMGRKKGAAFIPCGHTYCRECCREIRLNRCSCPLCNRPILEILDIF